MDANQFLEKARDPEAWFDRARILRYAADIMWNLIFQVEEKHIQDSTILNSDALQETAKMLTGQALESALKGLLIKIAPKHVEFEVKMDASGNATAASISRFGNSNLDQGRGHDLVALAEAAGILAPDKNKDLRESLRHFSEYVTWAVRYPIPKKIDARTKVFDKEATGNVVVASRILDIILDPEERDKWSAEWRDMLEKQAKPTKGKN